MLLDVRPILYDPGKSLNFSLDLDLSDLEFAGHCPATRPVRVEGRAANRAGVLTLDLTASTILDARCDRCGKEFPQEKRIAFHCLLAQELQEEDNDEIVLLKDGQADVEELARTAFILEMDTKTLCSEDCEGPRSRSGAGWILGPDSRQREPDPRLAVLATLLENK